jgi:hypothetical protein
MGRTFSCLSLLCALSLLGGCFETEDVQAVSLDIDGDGVPDQVPAGTGGPWLECVYALEAAAGDPCDFEGMCGIESTSEQQWTDFVVCIDHRVVWTHETLPRSTGEPCDAAPIVDGDCVELSEPACFDGEAYRVTACVTDLPPDDGAPAEPWSLTDAPSCEALWAGGAQSGDPCVGDDLCEGEFQQGRASWPARAWCNEGSLRVVVPWALR